jgi:hypothetical protein
VRPRPPQRPAIKRAAPNLPRAQALRWAPPRDVACRVAATLGSDLRSDLSWRGSCTHSSQQKERPRSDGAAHSVVEQAALIEGACPLTSRGRPNANSAPEAASCKCARRLRCRRWQRTPSMPSASTICTRRANTEATGARPTWITCPATSSTRTDGGSRAAARRGVRRTARAA